MDNLTLIQSLDEAIRIISAARVAGHLASGSTAIWRLSDHAVTHLDKQIAALLAPPAETAAPELVEYTCDFKTGLFQRAPVDSNAR